MPSNKSTEPLREIERKALRLNKFNSAIFKHCEQGISKFEALTNVLGFLSGDLGVLTSIEKDKATELYTISA